MRKLAIYLLLIIMTASCTKKTNVSSWNDQQINDWFNKSEWVNLKMKPDASIDKRQFVEQNILNPEAWQSALELLREKDLQTLELGRYDIKGGAFVSIAEYVTKDIDTAYFEAHRKYIDIQYVPVGKEYIGLTSMENIDTISQPFDVEKDIEFFQKPDDNLLLADESNFFVFFPSDGHKPCVKVDENEKVRKVVVKIPYKEHR